jgi:putative membrane protein
VKRLAGFACGALLLAGCATRPPQPQPPLERPPQPPEAAEPVLPAQSPADYLRTAADYDLFIIRASETVLRRSPPERTRRLARRLLADHKGLAAQLSFAGRRLNLLPAPVLSASHQRRLDQLATTPKPEQWYWQYMIAEHHELLWRHRAFAREGSSPTLRAVAVNAVKVEEQHLRLLPPR